MTTSAPEGTEHVDVVVIGFGDAGATAALTAEAHGADVVVLERQRAEDPRPNSRYAAGFFIVPNDRAGAATYLHALYAVNGEDRELDPALIDTWVREAATVPAWLDELGCPHESWGEGAEHELVDGADAISTRRVTYTGGIPGCPLYAFLTDEIVSRGIDVRHGCDVQRLLVDDHGAVVGVESRDDVGGVTQIRARSVVLATGGFEADERWKRQFLPVWPVHFFGTRRNDGAGIRMATRVGADLWHMNTWPGRLVGHFPDSGYAGGVSLQIWGQPGTASTPGGMFVDADARRFMPEPSRQHAAHHHAIAMDPVSLRRPAVPAWWIFDRRRIESGPLPPTHSGPTGPVGDFSWSEDNRTEIARGWIRQASSVEELATACGLDPDQLEAEVDVYNAACRRGYDEDFGRDPSMLTPLDEGPFHAVQLWPGGSHTVGGPRRDALGRVLRQDSSVIDGLFACGEAGSMHGLLYPSGGASITECVAFGRVVGRAAAARAA